MARFCIDIAFPQRFRNAQNVLMTQYWDYLVQASVDLNMVSHYTENYISALISHSRNASVTLKRPDGAILGIPGPGFCGAEYAFALLKLYT